MLNKYNNYKRRVDDRVADARFLVWGVFPGTNHVSTVKNRKAYILVLTSNDEEEAGTPVAEITRINERRVFRPGTRYDRRINWGWMTEGLDDNARALATRFSLEAGLAWLNAIVKGSEAVEAGIEVVYE